MALANLIISGSTAALVIIQQYFANPTISGIPIECESYIESLDADISTQLIVSIQNGKQYVSDNIAPKPRTWSLKGYVGPTAVELLAAAPVLMPILQLKLRQLRVAFNSRKLLNFTTKYHEELVQVGIVNLTLETIPDVTNRQPISLTVREIPVLDETVLSGTDANPSDIANGASAPVATGTVTPAPFPVSVGSGLGSFGL